MRDNNHANMLEALKSSARDNFSRNLRWLMNHQGLRKADLARKVGRANSQVARWLEGETEPNYETKDAIAQVFDVPVSFLFRDSRNAS